MISLRNGAISCCKKSIHQVFRNLFLTAGQTIDDFLTIEVCVFLYNIFVQREQTPVAHYRLSVDHDMPDVAGLGRVNEARINVIKGCLVEIVGVSNS